MYRNIFILIVCVLMFSFCKSRGASDTNIVTAQQIPVFSPDSAYYHIQKQVDFGYRIPNTAAHRACADYLATALRTYGATVIEQRAQLRAFDGTMLDAVNIIGSYNQQAKARVLLFAHWDTRPWSDHDPVEANRNIPVLGANDGASGVGVLLELARLIQQQAPAVGVDIIFFDAEDYGAPESFKGNAQDSWCLGSQYWARHPHHENYNARFGILLDMVGAPDAKFYREYFSMQYAAPVVNKIWSKAHALGFSNWFVKKDIGAITDDHYYVNKIIGIPSANIIQYHPETEKGFGKYWHTNNDTMENIDKGTLNAVGTTVLHVLYNEK